MRLRLERLRRLILLTRLEHREFTIYGEARMEAFANVSDMAFHYYSHETFSKRFGMESLQHEHSAK
jgi:hypothetical protein